MRSFFCCTLIFLTLVACSRSQNNGASVSSTTQEKPPKPAATTSPSLDIIVGGPFVLLEKVACKVGSGSCLALWAPRAHSKMTGVSAPAQVKEIDAGDYDFESGIRGSATTNVLSPVHDSSIYPVSSSAGASATPRSKPFATFILPMPREIVSWNADPMQVVSDGSVLPTGAVTPNLATLVVLRYDFQTGDVPTMTNAEGDFWKAAPMTSGSEKFIIIGYTNGNVTGSMDPHTHAVAAFKALAKMLGLKWKLSIADPPSTFTRNRPFDPDPPSLPQDLLNIIDQVPIESQAKATPSLTPVVSILGKINDCKAPTIILTN